MSRSMLAAVQEAARGTGEPEDRQGADNSAAAGVNTFVAGFAAAMDFILGRGNGGAAAEQPGHPDPAPPPADSFTRADAAEIVALCNAAGVASMASALIKDGVSVTDAKARIDDAKEIKAAVDLARKTCPQISEKQVESYIAAGTPLAQVRSDLFDKMANAQSPDIGSAHQSGPGASAGELQARAPNASEIYSKRAKARAEWTLH